MYEEEIEKIIKKEKDILNHYNNIEDNDIGKYEILLTEIDDVIKEIESLIKKIDKIDKTKRSKELNNKKRRVMSEKDILIENRGKISQMILLITIHNEYQNIVNLDKEGDKKDSILQKIANIRSIIAGPSFDRENIEDIEDRENIEDIEETIDDIYEKYKDKPEEYKNEIEENNINVESVKENENNGEILQEEKEESDTDETETENKEVIPKNNNDATTDKKKIPLKDWIIIILFAICVIIAIIFQAISWVYVAILCRSQYGMK